MAATDTVVPAKQTFFVGDISYRRAVSEGILSKFASAINYIMNRIYIQEKIICSGFFNSNTFDDGYGGIIRVRRDSEINEYYMYVDDSGTSGNNQFNVAVYNSAGSFLGNLFVDNSLSISANSGSNAMVGREDINTTPSNIDFNTAGHTVSFGTLNFTQLDAGYVLVPFIEDNGLSANNLTFNLKMQEL